MDISIPDAAGRLGVSDATVRRLIRRGELLARRSGHVWLVADADVSAVARRPSRGGRPLSARSAWAIIAVLSGEDPHGLSRSELARARIRAAEAGDLQPGELRSRARVLRLIGPAGVADHILDDPRAVASGVSASSDAGLGIVSPGFVEAYLRPEDEGALLAHFGLRPASAAAANVVLRVPHGRWPFGDRRVAPPAVAAVDVLDAGDSRSVAAAHRVLAHLAQATAA